MRMSSGCAGSALVRNGGEIVGSYEDVAISGSGTILRPGIQRLMRDAQHGEFDILLAEALDRISRDEADVATLYKQLKFAGSPSSHWPRAKSQSCMSA